MKKLYIDNLRGFSNALIPISDVSFLVGENSTGKSTVLSLLHMFSSGMLLWDPDFDSDEYHMGGFEDLVTSGSANTKSFTIGQTKMMPKGDGMRCGAAFFTFTSDEGFPSMSRFSYLLDDLLIVIETRGGIFRYGSKNLTDLGISKKDISDEHVLALAKIHSSLRTKIVPNSAGTKEMLKDRYYLIYTVNQILDSKQSNSGNTKIHRAFQYFHGGGTSSPWIAPIRAKPKRTYDASKGKYDSEGSHTPYMIRTHFGESGEARSKKSMFNKFGNDGNLFDSIKIKQFGSGNYSPFEVQIELGNNLHSIANVGYGVSQALPVVVECILSEKNTKLFIQQPEVHLHPKAQASFGSLLWQMVSEDAKTAIVETHSDYLIDRFRHNLAKSKIKVKCDILFFERTDNGNHVTRIAVGGDGRYSEDQPETFRKFFLNEQMDLLDL